VTLRSIGYKKSRVVWGRHKLAHTHKSPRIRYRVGGSTTCITCIREYLRYIQHHRSRSMRLHRSRTLPGIMERELLNKLVLRDVRHLGNLPLQRPIVFADFNFICCSSACASVLRAEAHLLHHPTAQPLRHSMARRYSDHQGVIGSIRG
jgi:hypothetical protein